MALNADLLTILVCPVCRGALQTWGDGPEYGLKCPACSVVYPVQEDIPIMLKEKAIPILDWERKKKTNALP